MKRMVLSLVLAGVAVSPLFSAQTGPWVRSAAGSTSEVLMAVAADTEGNTYTAGYYYGATVDFGTGTLFNASGGSQDIFIVKYDPAGTALWARSVGGSGQDGAEGIAVDGAGNAYVVGYFMSSSIDFGTGALTNASAGTSDVFIVKYNPSGTALWANRYGGTASDIATCVDADLAGNIHVAGDFSSTTINFGTGALTNNGANDIFTVKFAGSGSAIWARAAGGTGIDVPDGVTIDGSGNTLITGWFRSSSIDFGTGALTLSGVQSMFVAKFGPTGTTLWAKDAGNGNYVNGADVETDAGGNVYVAGSFFAAAVDFGTGAVGNSGGADICLVKYDSTGTALWVRTAGTSDGEYPVAVAIDNSGNTYVTGQFVGAGLDFGTGPLSVVGGIDFFYVKYTSDGGPVWAGARGGTDYENVSDIAVDPNGNIVLGGYFASPSLDLGVAVLQNPLPPPSSDIFVLRETDEPRIRAATDVPADQGGELRLSWYQSAKDQENVQPPVVSYAVWRKVPDGLLASGYKPSQPPAGMSVDAGDFGDYDYITSIPAVQSISYNVIVPTLSDSSADGVPYAVYIVSAHTELPANYTVSPPDSAYSVDNLSPIAPAGLAAAVQAGPVVALSWDPPTDPDVKGYLVFRSATPGFTPTLGDIIGSSQSIGFTDGSPAAGSQAYYRIMAVDVHDNIGQPSAEAFAAVTVPIEYGVQEKWNIVSVPLAMADYSTAALFPSATSGAYGFADGYFAYATLENGRGYWVKFSSAGTIHHDGLSRVDDTVDVKEGWNMIGSLSVPISAGSVGSIPGGIITSSFYGYDGSYGTSATLDPGRGYWVKAMQTGYLVLSSVGAAPENRIRIEDKGELPPPPPDGNTGAGVPLEYALGRNYPNPFNPLTRIDYVLPRNSEVRLSVFNTLGQEVAVLSEGMQEAGARSVWFDAAAYPSGVYAYRLRAGSFTATRKMILMK